MPQTLLDPQDDLRNRELGGDNSQSVDDEPGIDGQGGGGNRAKEFYDDARDTYDNIKDLSKKAKGGAPAGEAGAGAGAEAGATGGAATGGAATGGAATGGAGVGAGAGTAGAEAGAGAVGAATTGGAAATGAATTGAAAGGLAATGAVEGAAGGVAAASAAAGTATAETGVGAAIGYGIAIAAVGAGFIAKYHKEFFAFGAILFVGALLIIIGLLNALKPIAATQQTSENYLGPLQQIVDNRSEDVLGRYITGGSDAAVGMASQQEKVAANGGHVLAVTSDGVVNDGKLKTLYDAMKASNFEGRLKEKYDLEFKPGNGAVDIVHKGQTLGSAHTAVEATAIMRQRFPESQTMLSEDVNGWSWAQHTKVARGVMRGGMIPTLAIPNAEEARDEAQLTDVVKYQYSTILKPGLDNLNQGISCYTAGTGCNSTNTPVSSEAEAGLQTDERSSMVSITQKTYQENLDAIKSENGYNMSPLGNTTNAKVSASLNDSSVGLLGWLDIAATTKAMSEKEGAQELPSTLRSKQSGALWAWNLSSVNQMLGKDVTSPAAALITRNYENLEDSQAYGYVAFNDASRGQGMKDSQKVNSKMGNAFSYVYQSLLVEDPVIKATMGFAFDAWLVLQNFTPVPALLEIAVRTPIGNLVNQLLATVLEKIGVLAFVEETLGISTDLLLPICDAADKSYNFFNCMATGAHTVANQACEKYFGCAKISMAQENALKVASRQDMQARLAALPLERRLFDQAIPGSFINVAAMNSPLPIKATNDVASLFQGVFSAVWSAPGRVASMAAAPAKAISADSSAIDGIDYIGIPLDVIRNTPLAGEASQANGTCPAKPAGEINMCLADMSTIDALTARFTLNPALGG